MATKREKIKARIKSALTVAQVIEKLQALPQDALVGACGHFGEFHPLDEYDIEDYTQKAYITAESWSWRDEEREEVEVAIISWPDIGEAPD